jgi:hypothetical protein
LYIFGNQHLNLLYSLIFLIALSPAGQVEPTATGKRTARFGGLYHLPMPEFSGMLRRFPTLQNKQVE